MAGNNRRATTGPALRGALVGTASALIAFGGVSVALAATQAGIKEATAPAAQPSTTQAGMNAAQKASESPKSVKVAQSTPARTAQEQRPTQVKQAGLEEAIKPMREVKEEDRRDERDERRELSAEVDAGSAQLTSSQIGSPQPAPVQQAPSYPVQQAPAPAPAPVQQAPAPAPAPVQQAPAPAPVQQAPAPAPATAPAPGLTIDLGGRAPVVPQAPIAPTQLHIG